MNMTQPAPVRELENTIGYRFSDPELLTNALIHTSYVNEARSQGVREDNERLEFLGDSVLSLTVTDYLYRTSGLKEGVLTRVRAAVVCEDTLASKAEEISLGKYLFLGHGELMSNATVESVCEKIFNILKNRGGKA